MGDYTPVYGEADAVTYTAGGPINGGDALKFSGFDQVAQADSSAGNFAGVAAHDAVVGQLVTVYAGSGVVHETRVSPPTAAGALVYVGATNGELNNVANAPYTMPIGVAMRSTTGLHGLLRWKALIG